MTAHEPPHLARAMLDLERQLTEERLRREQAEAALSRQMAYGMDVNKARVAAIAALDSRDCTYREGGDTRHCRTDRPCLRCQLYAAQRERERAEAERDALAAALRKYGRHAETCEGVGAFYGIRPCGCGLAAARGDASTAAPACSCDNGVVCIRCPVHNPSGTWED